MFEISGGVDALKKRKNQTKVLLGGGGLGTGQGDLKKKGREQTTKK